MRRAVVVSISAVCAALVASGCTSRGVEPPGLTASASELVVASVTPSSSPSPTGIVESSDPVLGIAFDEVPDLIGDEAEVYNWVATFQKEYWRTLTTNTLSPGLSILASPAVQARLASMAQENASDEWVFDGKLHVRISDVAVQDDSATASVCNDFAEVTVTAAGTPLTLEEAGSAEPRSDVLTLVRVPDEGRWLVQESETVGTC